jgi:ketose-bisphosphate aldolase
MPDPRAPESTRPSSRPANVVMLHDLLVPATREGFAVGAFAARYTSMVRPILRAAQAMESPAIVQISQKELMWAGITPCEMAREFFNAVRDEEINVPLVLHLDHTRDVDPILDAISHGFTSVMIDASAKPLADNIAVSADVVAYAHPRAVSVEAELGRIGTTDFVETDRDDEMYTDPAEAREFIAGTGADALAVSIGTAHGVYKVRKPKIDLARLSAIRRMVATPLVLHGGSGVPAEMMQAAIRLPGGGVSKVNIATDLELAWLGALGRENRMSDADCRDLSIESVAAARQAVQRVVEDKICNFVLSRGRAQMWK